MTDLNWISIFIIELTSFVENNFFFDNLEEMLKTIFINLLDKLFLIGKLLSESNRTWRSFLIEHWKRIRVSWYSWFHDLTMNDPFLYFGMINYEFWLNEPLFFSEALFDEKRTFTKIPPLPNGVYVHLKAFNQLDSWPIWVTVVI